MMPNKLNRHISAAEYFTALQLEYLLYELRTRIYPFTKDKDKFRSIMNYKKTKIDDISVKNNLKNIFNDNDNKIEIEKDFYTKFLKGEIGTGKDKYYYYSLKSEFAYSGQICKLIRYDISNSVAEITFKKENKIVSLSDIKRIL